MTSAAERLLTPGPEEERLAERAGTWNVVATVGGKLTRSDMLITSRSASHELKQQHFISADGTGQQWLAVQYEYRR